MLHGIDHVHYNKPDGWCHWSFREKIGWRCRNPSPDIDYASWADKHRAKEVVQPHFIAPRTIALAKHPGQIERRDLPGTYVMKTTNGWNRCMLVVDTRFRGTNRTSLLAGQYAHNIHLRRLAAEWLEPDLSLLAREPHYRHVEPGILFEEYLPVDYELLFFLFSGVCRMTMVVKRPFHHPGQTYHRIYDQDWNRLEPGSDATRNSYDESPEETPRPGEDVFDKLKTLCEHIDHVRADFLVSAGQLYFGEFTFTHNAGFPSLLGCHERVLTSHWPDVRVDYGDS